VRFLVLMAEKDHFDRWAASSDTEQQAVFDCFKAFGEAVGARGEMVVSEPLDRPSTARTLSSAGAADRSVREGPYTETVEQLGGFFLVDLPDLDTAVELARLLPAAYSLEVRPVVDVSST
jgi:hypothetical protein